MRRGRPRAVHRSSVHRAVTGPCHARRMVPRAAVAMLALALAGCAETELPPPARPATSPPPAAVADGTRVAAAPAPAVAGGSRAELDEGRQIAVVDTRERVLETFDAASGTRIGRADAGVGPNRVVT